MSERPKGDAVDQEFRRAMADISSVVDTTPELDDLLTPLPNLTGEEEVHQLTRTKLLVALAATAVVVVVGLLALDRGTDNPEVDTADDPPASTTTTLPEPSPESGAPVDPATYANWQAFEEDTTRPQAAECAASYLFQRIGWTIGIQEWSFPFDLSDTSFTFPIDKAVVRDWLPGFTAYINLRQALLSDFAPESADHLDTVLVEIEVLQADLDLDGTDETDLGDLMRAWWESVLEVHSDDQHCPLGSANRRIDDAMANFSSDSESFGGRGATAASRCAAMTSLRLVLADLVERGADVPLTERADNAFAVALAFWDDRAVDQAFIDLTISWEAIVFDGGLTDADSQAQVSAVLEGLLAYRASMRGGEILCPLDPGSA